MLYHIPCPKYCIVGLPVTLCKLGFVQVYSESFEEEEANKVLGADILRVIQKADSYYANRTAFDRKVLEMLSTIPSLDFTRQELAVELDWFFNRVLGELKQMGFLRSKLPFNSMVLKDQDSLFFAKINKKDLEPRHGC